MEALTWHHKAIAGWSVFPISFLNKDKDEDKDKDKERDKDKG